MSEEKPKKKKEWWEPEDLEVFPKPPPPTLRDEWRKLKADAKRSWKEVNEKEEAERIAKGEPKRTLREDYREFARERRIKELRKERSLFGRFVTFILGIVSVIIAIPMILSIVGLPIGVVALILGVLWIFVSLPARTRARFHGIDPRELEPEE